ncbi:YuiA family protein [Priestia koreensis]|uniref:Heat-shock protein n=1 Tax=Priestia koreensis TaxID=284581 RepID=A0A0M0LBQ2_9BACI|nr:YuiA family protein [Priestia koreensis]KOO48505.1 heat-shock protein [Priestia koreensis]MCM3004422.1 YuiA family protein [Priestia koreensis]UNL84635.1 hypothetical protein IE339_21435 [Priestia koreensis]
MKKNTAIQQCSLCEGRGYVHLILGGTETCVNCHGKGEQK